MPSQGGARKPVKHRTFALGMDGTVEGGQRQVLPSAHSLLALGTVRIDVGDDVGPLTFLPQRRGEAEAEDFGALGAWSLSLDGAEDIVGFAEVFLPQASRFAVDAAPFGVVVIGVAFDTFFFHAFHMLVSCPPWMVLRRSVRDYSYNNNPYLLEM